MAQTTKLLQREQRLSRAPRGYAPATKTAKLPRLRRGRVAGKFGMKLIASSGSPGARAESGADCAPRSDQ